MACGPSCTNCPACRGEVSEVSQVSQAMHDLGWGMMVGIQESGSARFWQVALVGDVFRSGSARDSILASHVEQLARGEGSARSNAIWGEDPGQVSWAGAAFRRWRPWEKETPAERKMRQEDCANLDLKLTRRKSIPTGNSTASRGECCVLEFKYPSEFYFFRAPITADLGGVPFVIGESLGVHFEASAKYSDQQPCVCACCQFEQYVEYALAWWNDRADESQQPQRYAQQGLMEDCAWVYASEVTEVEDANGVVRDQLKEGVKPRPASVAPDPGKGEVRWYCYGGGRQSSPASVSSIYSKSQCNFEMCDEPSVKRPGPSKAGGVMTFIGQIVDVCHNRAVKRREQLTLAWQTSGAMSAHTWSGSSGATQVSVSSVAQDDKSNMQERNSEEGQCLSNKILPD